MLKSIIYSFFFLLSISIIISINTACKISPIEPHVGYVEIIPYYFNHPAWHPGGEWIAVKHADSIDVDKDGVKDNTYSGIWLVHSESAEKKPLIEGFSLPSWSHDGKKLALGFGAQIYRVDIKDLDNAMIDTSTLIQITKDGKNFYPDWSFDQQWIVYSRSICEGPTTCGVWYTDISGVEHFFVADYGMYPNWHPLYNSLLYIVRSIGSSGEILGDSLYSFNIDTRSKFLLKYLHGNNITNRQIKYSPNGQQIAFFSSPISGPPAIWIMNSDGSNLKKISPDYAYEFDWSPDGNRIVFLFWDFLINRPGNGNLWLINKDGTGLKQLTNFQGISSGKEVTMKDP